jgi:hypothetical protein
MLDLLSEDDEVWQDFARRAHHTPPDPACQSLYGHVCFWTWRRT